MIYFKKRCLYETCAEHGHTTSDSTLTGAVKYDFFTTLFHQCFGTVVTFEQIKQLLEDRDE